MSSSTSVPKLSAEDFSGENCNRRQVRDNKDGKFRFYLKAANGEIIVPAGHRKPRRMPKKALRRRMKTAPDAMVIDLFKEPTKTWRALDGSEARPWSTDIQTGRGRHPYPARRWLINNVVTAWGENSAETTAGKLWSRETGVVLDTCERLGASVIAESTLAVVRSGTGTLISLHPKRNFVTPQDRRAAIVDLDSSNRISLNRAKGIAKTRAANWAAPGQRPEVAPPGLDDLVESWPPVQHFTAKAGITLR
jgi:uncharacterized protein YegP (UPF0339 family)